MEASQHSQGDGATGSARRNWRRDRWFWGAILVALLIRIVPMILFIQGDCVRDECIYRSVAGRLLAGEGLTTSAKGWLPAPGYPYLIAGMKAVFGAYFAVKFVQIGLSLISIWTMYIIGLRLTDRRTARISAWLFALHPTLAFFTNTMWIETVYIFFLLWAVLGVLWARDGSWRRGVVPGLMLGVATLFRGVATYLPPMFAVALLWPDDGLKSVKSLRASIRARWKHALALGLAWLVSIAPYSMYGSSQHGGFMVTDATVGHVLFLGNNDFPPLTFDYGNGMLSGPIFARYLRTGRRPCDRNEPPVVSGQCEVSAAADWISRHPSEFVDRVPMRLAQLVNPNSFLTRHVRWGYWDGIPWWFKEFTVIYVILSSFLVMVVGTMAAFARASGPYGAMAVGTVLYTVATSMVMYGMTRFRLPLEPLWMIYLAMFLAHPRAVMGALGQSTVRSVGAVFTLPILFALMLWYLPTGFPMFW